jgi:hypothetical protein
LLSIFDPTKQCWGMGASWQSSRGSDLPTAKHGRAGGPTATPSDQSERCRTDIMTRTGGRAATAACQPSTARDGGPKVSNTIPSRGAARYSPLSTAHPAASTRLHGRRRCDQAGLAQQPERSRFLLAGCVGRLVANKIGKGESRASWFRAGTSTAQIARLNPARSSSSGSPSESPCGVTHCGEQAQRSDHDSNVRAAREGVSTSFGTKRSQVRVLSPRPVLRR